MKSKASKRSRAATSPRRKLARVGSMRLLEDLSYARKLLLKARKECPRNLVLPGIAFIGWNEAINALKTTIKLVKHHSSNAPHEPRGERG